MEPASISNREMSAGRKQRPAQTDHNTTSASKSHANYDDIDMLGLGSLKEVPAIDDLPDPTNHTTGPLEIMDPSNPHIWDSKMDVPNTKVSPLPPQPHPPKQEETFTFTRADTSTQHFMLDTESPERLHLLASKSSDYHYYFPPFNSFDPSGIFYHAAANCTRTLPLPIGNEASRGGTSRGPLYTVLPPSFGATYLAREGSGRSYSGPGRVDEHLKNDMEYWQRRHFEKWDPFGR